MFGLPLPLTPGNFYALCLVAIASACFAVMALSGAGLDVQILSAGVALAISVAVLLLAHMERPR
ncbi:MAG: hypothetical protein ACSLFM_04555 [Tepidiformaceae bacterium]